MFDNYATGGAINFRLWRGEQINGVRYGFESGSFGYVNNYAIVGGRSGLRRHRRLRRGRWCRGRLHHLRGVRLHRGELPARRVRVPHDDPPPDELPADDDCRSARPGSRACWRKPLSGRRVARCRRHLDTDRALQG